MFSVQDAVQYVNRNRHEVAEVFVVYPMFDEDGFENPPFIDVIRGRELKIPPEEEKHISEISFIKGDSYVVLVVDQGEIMFVAENQGGMEESQPVVMYEDFDIDVD